MTDLPVHLKDLSVEERADFEDGTLRLVVADTFSMLLEDLGLSRRELARRLGVAEPAVSRMLSGSQNLQLGTIARIATALGVRVRPQLVPGFRAGTPSENDPPLPQWVSHLERPMIGVQASVLAADSAESVAGAPEQRAFVRNIATSAG